jgi:hypothetical protein
VGVTKLIQHEAEMEQMEALEAPELQGLVVHALLTRLLNKGLLPVVVVVVAMVLLHIQPVDLAQMVKSSFIFKQKPT